MMKNFTYDDEVKNVMLKYNESDEIIFELTQDVFFCVTDEMFDPRKARPNLSFKFLTLFVVRDVVAISFCDNYILFHEENDEHTYIPIICDYSIHAFRHDETGRLAIVTSSRNIAYEILYDPRRDNYAMVSIPGSHHY